MSRMGRLIALSAPLILAVLPLSAAGPPYANRGDAIVTSSNPTEVTHTITSRGVTLGFSDLGGGYVNFFDQGRGNEAAAGYGRGWQMSIRDQLHSGRYNPTQAGFLDHYGAPVNIEVVDSPNGAGGRLVIPSFQMPLYGDGVNDFLENEDMVQDQYKDDNQNSDDDGLDESGLTSDDELRSEFDFEGLWEDYSGRLSDPIPVFRFAHVATYKREPSVSGMLQFGKDARLRNGKPVLSSGPRPDIAPDRPGRQVASDVDLQRIIYSATNIRFDKAMGYKRLFWVGPDGQWASREIVPGQTELDLKRMSTSKDAPAGAVNEPKMAKGDFAVIADGPDPDKAVAVGIYVPQRSDANRRPVLGLRADGSGASYASDRRLRSWLYVAPRGTRDPGVRTLENGYEIPSGLVHFGYRTLLTGMTSPANSPDGHVEALRVESFVLAGAPNEIRAAVEELAENYAD